MKTVIYGSQGIALGAFKAIETVFSDTHIDCFLVTKKEKNASILGGLPVRELDEYVSTLSEKEKSEVLVLLGVPENVMGVIEESLDFAGLFNHVRLDSERWAEMQEAVYRKTRQYIPLSLYACGNKKPILNVYKIVHEKDKPFAADHDDDPEYMKTLQVGAAISSIFIAEIKDNVGDNISEKNGNYSELTGLYWIWKNQINISSIQSVDYYGLAHYRRFLNLTDDDLTRLTFNDIDVVLPYPMSYEPNIEAHHLRYLSNIEWNAVLLALKELHPECAKVFKDILKQGYLYNYNVVLAKTSVLNDYCRWLFPILFRVEQIVNPDGRKKANRYIGYIGETLETLYFMSNKDRLKIAHSCCRFLI